MMLTVSRGKGQANSDSTTYNNSLIEAGQTANITSGADTNVVGGNAADKAGGIGVSVSVDSSSSQSKQSSRADNARGSAVVAGGNISIQATGSGEDSDLTIQGSTVKAGGQATLKADDEVRLLAAANTTQEDSRQSSKSGSVGVTMQLGAGGGGIGVTASASRGTGRGAGTGTTYTKSQVEGQTVHIESGGDTTLKGAVVKGERVTATVGGNLTIESLQDTNQYDEKSQQVGGSVMVGAGGSASVNFAKTKIDSDYQSVNEQTSIRAGDGGFQVNVAGKTDLVGGQITSTQAAIDNNQNRFETGDTLTTSDLQNSASFEAKSVSVGVGTSGGKVAPGGVGFGSDSGSARSTTTAGISGVAGDTAARTGDKETGIGQIFDAAKVKQELDAQVKITQEFNKQAGKAIEGYVAEKRIALQEQIKNGTDEQKAQAEQVIKDVNMQERALNILVAGLTGMAGSVVTKEALSTVAEKMRDLMIEDSKKFAGVVDSTGKPLFSNQSGQSAGVNGDGFKLGGTRADLDVLCGAGGERCEIPKNADGSIDTSKPVTFKEDYAEFLKSPDGQKMLSAPFGGLQGGERTLFGETYEKGSWQDKLIEAFAGPHDLIGGKHSGLYDGQGNATQGRSQSTKTSHEIWSGIALIPSAPLAASQVIPPEVWKAIGILLKAGQ